MRFDELLQVVSDEPVFDSGLLLAGDVDPNDVHRQLSRWTRAGKILQLRRGLYALATPWRRVDPHPFLVANRLAPGSYVSLQSALDHHGLIPEAVPVTTSVGPMRSERRDTPLGRFVLRSLDRRYVGGYEAVRLTTGRNPQHAFVATPEQALLDLVHLEPGGDDRSYLESLRLDDLDRLDLDALLRRAEEVGKPKLMRGASNLAEMASQRLAA